MASTSTLLTASAGQPRLALAALFLGAGMICWSGTLVKLSPLGPEATAFHRVFLALPMFWLWLLLEERSGGRTQSPRTPRDYWLMALAGLFFAGDLAFWHWALTLTSVANAALLGNTAPIFVTLAGWAIFGERFKRTFLLGMALALAGAALLIGDSLSFGMSHLMGDLLGIVTAAFYGGYILTVKQLRARFSTAAVSAWNGLACAAALLVLTLASGGSLVAATAEGWAVLLTLALLCQFGGGSLLSWSLAHLPAAFSSVVLLLTPAGAAVSAWIILGESLGAWQFLGAAVIFGGILLARRGSREPTPPEA